MPSTTDYIGKPTSRVDGRAKVTGEGKYAAEYNVPNLTYGVVVSSGIAKGSITKIDTSEALAVEGVLQVFTHENVPPSAWLDRSYKDEIAPPGAPFRPLHGKDIVFSGQPIALVVAEGFEIARFAATLVRVEYNVEAHVTDLESKEANAKVPPTGKAGFVPPPNRAATRKRLYPARLPRSWTWNTTSRANTIIRWSRSPRRWFTTKRMAACSSTTRRRECRTSNVTSAVFSVCRPRRRGCCRLSWVAGLGRVCVRSTRRFSRC